jgi:hypothetical protein
MNVVKFFSPMQQAANERASVSLDYHLVFANHEKITRQSDEKKKTTREERLTLMM